MKKQLCALLALLMMTTASSCGRTASPPSGSDVSETISETTAAECKIEKVE